MSENDQQKEIRRLSNLVSKIAELAEHVEQTGSFESGAQNSVKRYNAVVERLEAIEAVPAGMFPRLDEDAKFGQLGAEATLLGSYLQDMVEEEGSPAPGKGPDIHNLVALAPFLGSKELGQLVRERFLRGKGEDEDEGENGEASEGGLPDLRTIVSLAPHMKSSDLAGLLQGYIARHGTINPKYLTALAPHISSEHLGQLLRNSAPEWFQTSSPEPQEAPGEAQTAPVEKASKNKPAAAGEKTTDWVKDLGKSE